MIERAPLVVTQLFSIFANALIWHQLIYRIGLFFKNQNVEAQHVIVWCAGFGHSRPTTRDAVLLIYEVMIINSSHILSTVADVHRATFYSRVYWGFTIGSGRVLARTSWSHYPQNPILPRPAFEVLLASSILQNRTCNAVWP